MKGQRKHIYRCATVGLLGLGLAFVAFAGSAGAQGDTTTTKLTVQPPSSDQPIKQGDPDFDVNILVSDMHNLAGYQFSLQYDPSVLKFVDVKGDTLLGSTGREVNCPTKNDNSGLLQFVCVTLAPPVGSLGGKAGPDGSGTLAVVTFAPKGGGDSPLNLTDVKLVAAEVDQGGMPVETPSTTEDASVHVVGTSGGFPWLVIALAVGAVVVVGGGGGAFIVKRRRGNVHSEAPAVERS
ncbi:MAG: cohesin domain-containing protein [Dehalococcoidia bacterium]|jgi:hypothetical protein